MTFQYSIKTLKEAGNSMQELSNSWDGRQWHNCPCNHHIKSYSIHWVFSHNTLSKVPPFDSFGIVSYLTSIAAMAVSCTISKIHQLIGQKSPNFITLPLVFGTPDKGEAIGVKQRPPLTKNLNDGAIRW